MKKKRVTLATISSKNIAFMGIVIIFIILILQSAVALFFDVPSESIGQIDIVFRTATSSIFGYIMSVVSIGDFTLKEKIAELENKTNTIGFNIEAKRKNSELKIELKSENESSSASNSTLQTFLVQNTPPAENKTVRVNIQIIVLTLTCVFCLLIMLVVRNFSNIIVTSSTNLATVSTYRDIISGSIGALIGLSRSSS